MAYLVQMSKVRIVIVPGNGGGNVERSNWYGWLRDKLREVSKRFEQRAQRGYLAWLSR